MKNTPICLSFTGHSPFIITHGINRDAPAASIWIPMLACLFVIALYILQSDTYWLSQSSVSISDIRREPPLMNTMTIIWFPLPSSTVASASPLEVPDSYPLKCTEKHPGSPQSHSSTTTRSSIWERYRPGCRPESRLSCSRAARTHAFSLSFAGRCILPLANGANQERPLGRLSGFACSALVRVDTSYLKWHGFSFWPYYRGNQKISSVVVERMMGR